MACFCAQNEFIKPEHTTDMCSVQSTKKFNKQKVQNKCLLWVPVLLN